MLKAKLSVVCVLLMTGAAVLLAGCSTTEVDKTAGMSPNKIYSEAKDEMSAGAYDKAVTLLEKLEGRAAGTPLAQQAQLDKAYARYKAAEPAEALAALDRFIKLQVLVLVPGHGIVTRTSRHEPATRTGAGV